MKKIILFVIRIYQKTISPDHGVFSGGQQSVCRFYPTCSQYTYEAVDHYGTLRGGFMGLGRIFRCHPFSKGGHDPVKKRVKNKPKEARP